MSASPANDAPPPPTTPRTRGRGAHGQGWGIDHGGRLLRLCDERWSAVAARGELAGARLHDVAFRDADNGWVVGARTHGAVDDAAPPATTVLRTRDGGQTWEDVLPPHLRRRGETARSIRLIGQAGQLIVVACTTRDGRGVIFSEDGGVCWLRGGMFEFGQLGGNKEFHA